MPKPKRDVYAVIGYVAWRVLAIVGVKTAKDKLAEHQRAKARH